MMQKIRNLEFTIQERPNLIQLSKRIGFTVNCPIIMIWLTTKMKPSFSKVDLSAATLPRPTELDITSTIWSLAKTQIQAIILNGSTSKSETRPRVKATVSTLPMFLTKPVNINKVWGHWCTPKSLIKVMSVLPTLVGKDAAKTFYISKIQKFRRVRTVVKRKKSST